LWYTKNGVRNTSFTGLAEYNSNLYYIVKGVQDEKYTGLVTYSDDNRYYVKDGMVDRSYTGICKASDGKYYYVDKGEWNKSYSGEFISDDGNYYEFSNGVSDGPVDVEKRGKCGTDLEWKYLKNNILWISGTGKMENYNSTNTRPNWYRYSSRVKKIIMDEGITSIGNCAFLDFVGIKECTIPNTVKAIGSNAFQGCKNITTIVLPDSVESVGAGVFNKCISLTEIYVPLSVNSIGDRALEHNGNENCYVNYEGSKEQWDEMIGNIVPGGDKTVYLYDITMP